MRLRIEYTLRLDRVITHSFILIDRPYEEACRILRTGKPRIPYFLGRVTRITIEGFLKCIH